MCSHTLCVCAGECMSLCVCESVNEHVASNALFAGDKFLR